MRQKIRWIKIMHNEDTKYFKNLNIEYLQNLYLVFKIHLQY